MERKGLRKMKAMKKKERWKGRKTETAMILIGDDMIS